MGPLHVSDLGTLALQLGWCLAIYAVGASLYGAHTGRSDFVASGRGAALALFGCVAVAVAIMLHALLTHDFQVEYVASYSSSTLPRRYTVAALWGGMAGSLLFWLFVLNLSATVVHLQNRERHRLLMPYVTATLSTISLFFLSLVVFVVPAFQRLPFAPNEGSDLNPLLQNYWMMIHPPSLYTGYVTVSVPFAFAIAALASGQLGDAWIRSTRRWTLFSWFFLTLGNVFGGAWAYEVLGWGGYWAWDPVENAAFMPWLVMTAFLHSVMIQEKKDMLKVWNVSLVILAFALTIFGTFLTRSGVISSVHSFTQSGLGPFFLWFLGFVLAGSIALVVWRLPLLRSENQLESFFSREAAFLFNNLILLGICFTIFWGTIFPVDLGVGARREDHRRPAVLQQGERSARPRACCSSPASVRSSPGAVPRRGTCGGTSPCRSAWRSPAGPCCSRSASAVSRRWSRSRSASSSPRRSPASSSAARGRVRRWSANRRRPPSSSSFPRTIDATADTSFTSGWC